MSNKKILPVSYPMITSWQWHATLFSILGDDEKAKNWIFSNYIQLRCYNIEEIFTGDEMLLADMMPGSSSLKECPYLLFSLMTKEQVESYCGDIINFIIKTIDLNGYVYGVFDEAKILCDSGADYKFPPIALATMMEHIGDISAISATTGNNFIKDPGLHRTLIGDGLATAFAAAFGGPANTTYGENTGVLELSRVYDPRVVRLAAVYAILLSFSPKVAECIGSLPASIIGGVSFMLYGMISAIGVRNVVENKVDFTKSRNLIVAAVILVSGLGFGNGITFTVAGTSITLTSLAIAAILGIALNAILPGKDYEFDE